MTLSHGKFCPCGHCRPARSSLFFRLMMILVLTGLLINGLVWGFWRGMHSDAFHGWLEDNLNHYFGLVVPVLGEPPDVEKTEKWVAETNWNLRYEPFDKPGRQVVVHNGEPVEEISHYERSCNDENYGWHHGSFFYIYRGQKGQFVFVSHLHQIVDGRAEMLIALLGVVALVLAGLWLILRRMLRPLTSLEKAMVAVGDGNLDARVPVQGRDELAGLSANFNDMAGNLKELINSKKQLLLDVSHELRTPITRMRLTLEMMPPGDQRESLSEDLEEIEKMVRGILEAESLKNGHSSLSKQPVNLAALLREVMAGFAGREPGLKAVDFPREMEWDLDSERIRTALKNVLDNALKYSAHQELPVDVLLDKVDGRPRVIVSDHGRGIAKDDLERVFEPFYRTDDSRARTTGGYGLGLNMVRRIMKAHGGNARAESREGEGASLILEF